MTLKGKVEMLPDDAKSAGESSQSDAQRPAQFNELGIEVAPLTASVAEQLGLASTEGVVVTSVAPGSPAAAAGIAESTVIVRVGKRPITNVDEFEAALEQESIDRGVLLLVRDSSGSHFIVVRKDYSSPRG